MIWIVVAERFIEAALALMLQWKIYALRKVAPTLSKKPASFTARGSEVNQVLVCISLCPAGQIQAVATKQVCLRFVSFHPYVSRRLCIMMGVIFPGLTNIYTVVGGRGVFLA